MSQMSELLLFMSIYRFVFCHYNPRSSRTPDFTPGACLALILHRFAEELTKIC